MLQIGGTAVAECTALQRAILGIQQAATVMLGQKNVWPEALAVGVSSAPVKVFVQGVAWGKLGGGSNMTHRDCTISGYIEQRRANTGILGDQANMILVTGLYGLLVLDTIDVNEITRDETGPGSDARFNLDGRIDVETVAGEGRNEIVLRAPFTCQLNIVTANLFDDPSV